VEVLGHGTPVAMQKYHLHGLGSARTHMSGANPALGIVAICLLPYGQKASDGGGSSTVRSSSHAMAPAASPMSGSRAAGDVNSCREQGGTNGSVTFVGVRKGQNKQAPLLQAELCLA